MKRDQALVLREALDEVLAFLGDRSPPALVADSVAELMRVEAAVLAAELKAWSVAEQRIRREATTTELLRHALCKLHVFQELNLFPGGAFRSYLDRVSALLLGAVPGDEQERFIDMVVELRGFDPREILALAPEPVAATETSGHEPPDWAGGGDGSSAGAAERRSMGPIKRSRCGPTASAPASAGRRWSIPQSSTSTGARWRAPSP